ncbi:heavy-metal-associated domain-containing protein [Chitinibacter fontanus]|uniref:Heavy-metal-associated domain-containing protein n=1 Tax=Chitinibacter fontanus TaxID=1737446 RepID=A0A7D5ZHZ6_9NEIS|nr:heavy-metal-associated domain-containing protein [Chitinibacter fontanus]QLI82668.1 heavy-metal-associated domain-containing protein [Chitinibacter fontanus]
MYSLKVTQIGCGSCVAKINNALKALDGSAEIAIDRLAGIIQVKSDAALDEIRMKLNQIGYPTTVV